MARKRIGELLIEAGVLSEHQLAAALAYQAQFGGRLGRILVEKKLVPEERLVRMLSAQLGVPVGDLPTTEPAPALLALIPRDAALSYAVFPVGIRRDPAGDVLFLAMADPSNVEAIEKLQLALGKRVMPFIAGELAIVRAIERWFPAESAPAPSLDAAPPAASAPPPPGATAAAAEPVEDIPLITGVLATPPHGVSAATLRAPAFGAPGSMLGDDGDEDGAMPPPVDFDKLTLAGPALLQPTSTPPAPAPVPAPAAAPELELVELEELVEEPAAALPEPEPVAALPEPGPEPIAALPEPEPIAALPEPEPIAADEDLPLADDVEAIAADAAPAPALPEAPAASEAAVVAESAADFAAALEVDLAVEAAAEPAAPPAPVAPPQASCPECGNERLPAARFCPHCGCSFTGAARAKSFIAPAVELTPELEEPAGIDVPRAAPAVVLQLFAPREAPAITGASEASRIDDADVILARGERALAPVIPLPLGLDPTPSDAARVDEPAAIAAAAPRKRSLAADWADVAERPIARREHGTSESITQKSRELMFAALAVPEEPAAPAPEPQVAYEPAAPTAPNNPAPWAAFASVRAAASDAANAPPPPAERPPKK